MEKKLHTREHKVPSSHEEQDFSKYDEIFEQEANIDKSNEALMTYSHNKAVKGESINCLFDDDLELDQDLVEDEKEEDLDEDENQWMDPEDLTPADIKAELEKAEAAANAESVEEESESQAPMHHAQLEKQLLSGQAYPTETPKELSTQQAQQIMLQNQMLSQILNNKMEMLNMNSTMSQMNINPGEGNMIQDPAIVQMQQMQQIPQTQAQVMVQPQV